MGASNNDRKRPHTEAEDIDPASFEDRDNGAVKSTKRARVEERRSLFVRSLPPGATSESLTDFFSEHYPVKHATVVVDQKTKESRGYGFVTFADAEDAVEAKKALNNQEWNGRRIRLDVAEPRQRNNTTGELPAHKIRKEEIQRPNKLIVRNLPWSIKKSEQLEHLFRSFGKVKFADLPQNKGKLKGFGFVTLRGRPNAERALEAINGKEIDGRTLAVDWAVDKDTWEKQQPEEESKKQKKGSKKQEDVVEEEDDDDPTSSEGSDDEDDEQEGGAEVNRDDQLDADLKNFFKNHMENLEDEEEEDDDDDDEDEDDDEELVKEVEALAPKKTTTDNTSTVFVRNLPFTTTDEQLKDFFGHFGKVRYARVVMDKVTEKPAGTGFVCFFDVDDAKSCIKAAPRPQAPATAANKNSILQDESADPDGKYTLDGRLLSVAQAVNKQEATNLADSSLAKRNEKDKRKLFLLNEGAIDKSSPLFNLLTEPEIRMRQASSAQRKKLVQGNPSLHLSLTRLALRNIPRNMDSKDLKELARKAVVEFAKDVRAGRRQPLSKEENARDGKDAKEKEHERKAKGKGIIRQAKIVFESGQGQKMQEKDGGKSRGYGFIEYTSHHWALMGLRYLNGLQLQNETGKKQRLVVEFAIENAQVVQRRRANEERSRQLNPEHNKAAKSEAQSKTNAQYTKDNKKRGHKDNKGGKDRRPGKPGRDAGGKQPEEEGGRKPETDAEMKHRLIARTRVMRKKKALSRGKK